MITILKIFDMPINNRFYDKVAILTNGFLCNWSESCHFCNGLDVSVNAVTKMKKEKIRVKGSDDQTLISLNLMISHVSEKSNAKLLHDLEKFGDVSMLKDKGDDNKNIKALYKEANFFIAPKRCEAYGFYGLFSFCAGMPSLVPEDSIAASVISGVSSEANLFIRKLLPFVRRFRFNFHLNCNSQFLSVRIKACSSRMLASGVKG